MGARPLNIGLRRHQPLGCPPDLYKLLMTYTITITGDTFSGDATATVTDPDGKVLFTGPATFTATPLKLDSD
jgi:hypothetical protein